MSSQSAPTTTETFLLRMTADERRWLETEARARGMSQNQFVLSLFKQAPIDQGQPSLFDSAGPDRPAATGGMFFTFVDLFAGIGGMRLGLERTGGHCVFSCEWDKHAQRTYHRWFREMPWGDINTIDESDIPDHDLLAAGFPCQPFSIAGVSKKKSLGRAHGFADAKQGNLFFRILDVIDAKRPAALLLENVKNLRSHDSGRTWNVIRSALEQRRYAVAARVLDAQAWVPQHRERIFIVGLDRDLFGPSADFEIPEPRANDISPTLADILEDNVDRKYTLSDHLWSYLRNYAKAHQAKGNGFGYGLADVGGVTRTLSARYFKDGSEILVPQPRSNPRRLTPREAARLMGFPDQLEIVVSDTQAYRQFGNAVVPAAVEHVAKAVVARMRQLMVGMQLGRVLPHPGALRKSA